MKIFWTIVVSLLSFSAFAQFDDEATIIGSLPKEAGKDISITGPNHFETKTIADASGSFKATFKAVPGYYLVRFGNGGYFVYAAPGLSFGLSRKDSTMYFAGVADKGAGQNNMIKQLVEVARQYFGRTDGELSPDMLMTPPSEFIATLDKYKSAALALLNSQKYDAFFQKTQADYIEYKARYIAYTYELHYGVNTEKQKAATDLITKRPAGQPLTPELSAKFSAALMGAREKSLSMDDRNLLEQKIWEGFDINNEGIYNYSGLYNRLVDARLTQLLNAEYATSPYLRSKGSNQNTYDIIKKDVTNNHIKQNLLYKYALAIIKAGKDADKYYNDYLTVANDKVFIADVKNAYNNTKLIAEGVSAPDFNFNNINNERVMLSSLRGNYVYIDVWAQWCVPCKNEIPALQEVEKRYEGQKIKFISLSIDRPADVKKWMAYVIDNKLGGIQLIADVNADWINTFNINTIPRFILIDPDGKIVSANADRPSNPKLKALFDKLLVKS